MKTNRQKWFLRGVAVWLLLVCAGQAYPVGAATLDSYVIAGGGGRSEGVTYTLEGTIGQTVAIGDSRSADISPGFWAALDKSSFFAWLLFLPAILGEGRE